MIALDSSVIVAAFASWHEAHASARRLIAEEEVRLVSHAALETYSVLTRLPPPHRVAPDVAGRYLYEGSSGPWLSLPEGAYSELVRQFAQQGIAGGSVYDGLIGATAAAAGLPLATRDRRAADVYRLVGADPRILT